MSRSIDRIKNFNEPLLNAFDKMVRGINVKITPEFRKFWGKDNLGVWFYIQAVHDDESLTICSLKHDIFEGVNVKDIIF